MSTHLPRAAQTAGASRAADLWPVLLCWVAVALDGYDLLVLGVVIPTLLEAGALGLPGPPSQQRPRWAWSAWALAPS
jgi:MFS transporter, AAHS family, benzoate transport protein